MKQRLFALVALAISNVALAGGPTPDLTCSRLTIGDPSNQQSKIIGSNVKIYLEIGNQRPRKALVEGLNIYPAGTRLTMNFQNVLGIAKPNDGEIIFVMPGQGDGTVQDICGRSSNLLMHDNRTQQLYCGTCSANPSSKLN